MFFRRIISVCLIILIIISNIYPYQAKQCTHFKDFNISKSISINHGKVIDNLKYIRKNNYQGELIARMTVMEQTDIYKQVKWLIENNEFRFSSVHWQLNAGFWGSDYKRRNFAGWSKKSYIPGIKKLVKYYKKNGKKERENKNT